MVVSRALQTARLRLRPTQGHLPPACRIILLDDQQQDESPKTALAGELGFDVPLLLRRLRVGL